MLKDQSIAAYLDELASGSSTPGGGAAAALTAAQGAALLSMVCNLTIGKKKFADVEAQATDILRKLEIQRARMLKAAQQDVDGFEAVMAAYRLPKNTEAESADRAQAVQAALKASSEIPFALFKLCAETLPLAGTLMEIGNPTVMSDVSVGDQLLLAGLLGAEANVYANLDSIEDEAFCAAKRAYMDEVKATLSGDVAPA